ncbi:archease [Fontimonas sp. SYSU GA230001]|uniref:archease n=1 Tax=Fontimonas sp. SYSU GA230001 TaxID=3142450 RepID=UPI0032B3EE4C
MRDALVMDLRAADVAAVLPRWEHFEHRADIGVRGIGNSLEQAFEQAALALTAVITDPAGVRAQQPVAIDCRGADRERLLVDWLNALVFEMANRRMLFSRFEVQIVGQQLAATAWGEALDPARHRPAAEVKGATPTELRTWRDALGQWIAQCVVEVCGGR